MSAAEPQSWNLLFEIKNGVAKDANRPKTRVGKIPSTQHHGWTGSYGPRIPLQEWPRSSTTGLPMMHVLTLYLPVEYQTEGSTCPGIAYFVSGGEPDAGSEPEFEGKDLFTMDLIRAKNHPMERWRRDILEGEHVLIWLTEDELLGEPIEPPVDNRRPGERDGDTELNAWDNTAPYGRVWLVPREDPNAGLASGAGFTGPVGMDGGLTDWAKKLHGFSHLGGTPLPAQGEIPAKLTPWYLELEEIGDANYGGDNVLLDLEADLVQW